MTPESHFSGLDNASAEIKAAVDVAFQQMLTDIRSGMSARKAASKAFSSFSGQFVDVLRAGLSERMGAISMAEVRAYPVGGVSLSARLYAQARETSAVAQRLVQAEAKGWHDARRLALDLYEGYGFRENEALRTRKPLPKYLRDAVAEAGAAWEKLGSVELGGLIDDATVGPSLARELAKIQASALRTPALKAAYMQVLEGLEYGVGQDRLQKLLKTAWHERNRYFANRIAQTELHRAYSTARASEIMDDDEIQAVQIRMSSRHPRTDICDYFSKADLYGLGPGAYPKGKAPSPPFHPHCRCVAHAVYATQKARAHFRPGAAREFLRSMDASDAAKVMGSRDKLEAVLRGADPIAVWNGNADPLYRVRTVGDVAKGGGLGIDGDMKTA